MPPSKTLGIAQLVERRHPKRLVAWLDVEGYRIRWREGRWVRDPWRWDP
jgi:hypothetical protein